MTAMVLPQPVESQPSGRGGIRRAVAIALAVWLLLVVSLGSAGAFVGPPGTPPLPIAIGVAAPLALFFACAAALAIFPRVRARRWIFGSLRESRPGDGPVWASSPSMRTRCSRLCSPCPLASETWPSGSRPRG